MFFNRFEGHRPDRKTSASIPPANSSVKFPRGAMALAIAVAAAAPVVLLSPSQATATTTMTEVDQALLLLAQNAKPTDPELLAKGADQYNKGQYEEAQATLTQVKPEGLPAADREKFTAILSKTESALMERKVARAAFEAGETALEAKNYAEALKQYQAAADNEFADAATKSKAQSQLQVARAAMGDSPAPAPAVADPGRPKVDTRAIYREAVADYKAGRMDQAKAKFQMLQAANYKPGLFDKKPAEYLRDIDKKTGGSSAVAETPRVDADPGATATPTPTATADANPAPTPDPAATPTPTVTASAGDPSPRQAYSMGVEAYNKGQYEESRRLFLIAENAGYKPQGLFRDPPSKFLRRIEQKLGQAPTVNVAAAADPGTAREAAPTTLPTTRPGGLDETARMEALRAEQRRFEAEQFVTRAQEAERAGRLQDAYVFYRNAREADPRNRLAVEGEARLEQRVTGQDRGGLLDRQLEVQKIRKEQIRYTFDSSMTAARTATEANNFDRARAELDNARVAKERDPSLFTTEELRAMDQALAQAQVTLNRREEEARIGVVANQADAAAQRQRELEEARIREERRTIATLTRTARQQIYDGQYQQALGTINNILAIDPTNDYAVGVKELTQDYALLQEQRRLRERHDLERVKQLNSAEEKKIPYMDVLKYPENWPDISELRDREVMAERQGFSPEEQQLQAILNRQLPEVRFDGVPFGDVVEFLRDVTGANIYVKWETLRAAGIERTNPVTARLRNIRFSKALDAILADLGGGTVKLAYSTDDGIIEISTADDLNTKVAINVYDIRDLLVIPPDFVEPPDFGLANESTAGGRGGGGGGGGRGGGGRGGGGGGGGLFGGGGGGGQQNTVSNAERTEELVTEITTLVKETVDRDSWVDNGGRFGALRHLSGQLIVTQTPENHRQLDALLDKLRESKAIQVSIESRFLTVQRNFLEDVGIDLDFFFNIENPNRFSPISVAQNSALFTANPITPAPGSIAGGDNFAPGMQIQGSFLDDFQVNFLIRATQASVNSTVLTAPRVTVFNGQQAFIVVAQQQAYVSDLEAVTGENVGLFNPIIDTVQTGVRLVVQPTVSADRKYVTLSLQPQVSNLVDIADFPVFGIVEEDDNQNNGGGGQQPQTFQAIVQLPILDITAVNTIVSVPDGGTLLLGGQTLAGETEVEEGVPILSKIPFVKRLFTNRSTAKDERILLILVKPTIIIQREVEQQQFPLLNTQRNLGQ